jgi:hypothetical protein
MNIAVNAATLVAAPSFAEAAENVPQRDFAGELRRLEYAIHMLRGRYICEGWAMDEDQAQAALDYYRGGCQEKNEPLLVNFCRKHGVSLDWILEADPVTMICASAARSPAATARTAGDGDRELHELVDQFWAADARATEYDERIQPLFERWHVPWDRLRAEHGAGSGPLGLSEEVEKKIFDIVKQFPESREHQRLVDLTRPHHDEAGRLLAKIWALPARTSHGRLEKTEILLRYILGPTWFEADGSADWEIQMTRDLLCEFVGGEQGANLKAAFKAPEAA